MRVLSLFSGLGAHDYGLERAGMEIVGQVEIDAFCRKALEKHFPSAHRWNDIECTTANDIRKHCGEIKLITGGFPCQDISAAGKKAGITKGEKSALFWEMWRLIRDLRPDWLLIENVPDLRTRGADQVLSSLEAIGYACDPFVVGAIHTGLPHKRLRVWIVGHRLSSSCEKHTELSGLRQETQSAEFRGSLQSGDVIRDTYGDGVWQQSGRSDGENWREAGFFRVPMPPGPHQYNWEQPRVIETQSAVGSAINGASRRLARWRRASMRAVGNANPPQIAYFIGRAILNVVKAASSTPPPNTVT